MYPCRAGLSRRQLSSERHVVRAADSDETPVDIQYKPIATQLPMLRLARMRDYLREADVPWTFISFVCQVLKLMHLCEV